MQFRKKSDADDDVVFIPDASLEDKLNERQLRSTYGVGYSLLMKQGFIPGGTLGPNKRGLTEPIRAAPRKRMSPLDDFANRPVKESREGSILRKDEVSEAVDIILQILTQNNDRMALWDLRNAIQRAITLSRRCKLVLSDHDFLRSLIKRQPALMQIGSYDLVSLQRPGNGGCDCECGVKFVSANNWIHHMLKRLETHASYVAALKEMRGDPNICCLNCHRKFNTALDLIYHARDSHEDFARALLFGLLWEDGIYCVEFLTALVTGDRTFAWSRFVSDKSLSPRSVINVSSDDDVEEIIDLGYQCSLLLT